jgi:hypothetical protein
MNVARIINIASTNTLFMKLFVGWGWKHGQEVVAAPKLLSRLKVYVMVLAGQN